MHIFSVEHLEGTLTNLQVLKGNAIEGQDIIFLQDKIIHFITIESRQNTIL